MTEHLSNHHRNTLENLFNHERSGNIHWREIESLLEAVGTVEERHNDKFHITVGDESITIAPPGHGDLDKQLIVDLRRLLKDAGLEPTA